VSFEWSRFVVSLLTDFLSCWRYFIPGWEKNTTGQLNWTVSCSSDRSYNTPRPPCKRAFQQHTHSLNSIKAFTEGYEGSSWWQRVCRGIWHCSSEFCFWCKKLNRLCKHLRGVTSKGTHRSTPRLGVRAL
jgi:hypothetical protein